MKAPRPLGLAVNRTKEWSYLVEGVCGGELRSGEEFVKMSNIRACLCVHDNDPVEKEKLITQEREGLIKGFLD